MCILYNMFIIFIGTEDSKRAFGNMFAIYHVFLSDSLWYIWYKSSLRILEIYGKVTLKEILLL